MSNNKQSSSVEWFAQESWKLRVELEDDKISIGEYANKHYQLKEQAKEMQKKQTVDFALKCMFAHVVPSQATREVIEKLFDEYYKEQFGGA